MKELPYYRLWVKDFDTDENVRVLDLAGLGLYIACLNHSWVNEGLPTDPLEIARALKIQPAQFTRLWARVEKCFHMEGGRLVNPRQEKERANAISKSQKSSEAVAERERKRSSVIIGRSSDDTSNDHPPARARAESEYVSESSSEVKKENVENFRNVLENENGFPEFRKLCEEIGVSGSPDDWDQAKRAWKFLDFEQKNAGMKGMEERRGVPDDPVVKSLPQNIVFGKKWLRKVREPPMTNPDHYESDVERLNRTRKKVIL